MDELIRINNQLQPYCGACGSDEGDTIWGIFIGCASRKEKRLCLALPGDQQRIQFIRQKAAWYQLSQADRIRTSFESIQLPPRTTTTTTTSTATTTGSSSTSLSAAASLVSSTPNSNTAPPDLSSHSLFKPVSTIGETEEDRECEDEIDQPSIPIQPGLLTSSESVKSMTVSPDTASSIDSQSRLQLHRKPSKPRHGFITGD